MGRLHQKISAEWGQCTRTADKNEVMFINKAGGEKKNLIAALSQVNGDLIALCFCLFFICFLRFFCHFFFVAR